MAADQAIDLIIQQVPDAFRARGVLRSWIHGVAKDHGTRVDRIAFVLMGDEELLHYNRRFLHHDDYTDVITFPVESNNGIAGDILISYDRVKENAASFGASAQHELHRVMVHGVLHLLGFKDKSKKDREAMRALEDRYLKVLAGTRSRKARKP